MRTTSRTARQALWCGAFVFLLAGPASATDFGPYPLTQWSGFYVGGQLGGAWSDGSWDYDNRNWFNTLGRRIVISSFDLDAEGVYGGGQLGYNYQTGAWVLGIEASLAGAELDASRNGPFFPQDRYSSNISWLTTVTGRLGYASGSWLAYAKGGWAGADVELTLFDPGTPVRAHSSTWANGWTVGGGAEYQFSPRVSLGVEYDYIELDTGSWTVSCGNCPSGLGGGVPVVDGDLTVQAVTARLNYFFGR